MTISSVSTFAEQQSAPAIPEVGQLVQLRGQQWVVTDVITSRQPEDELATVRSTGRTIVTCSSVSDDDLGVDLRVVWEVEPGRAVISSTQLPEVSADGWDEPQQLGAFIDAVRWGTVASADTSTLQAPFRSGITIEEYQLEPVARALRMPRVNLLVADDVGLGKTIEAGLVVQELLLRHRARRVLVVCPATLALKWRDEMAEKFGLDFVVLDTAKLRELRRTHGLQANPFSVYPRVVISLQWLRTPRVQRLMDEVLTPQTRYPGYFDLLVVDEVHHCAPPVPRSERGYAVDSLQTRAVRRLGEHSQHRLFLSATPHNGHRESWQALLEMLDPQRFARGVDPDQATVRQIMVRRLKDELINADGTKRFPGRNPGVLEIDYTDDERRGHALLQEYIQARRQAAIRGDADGTRGNDLVSLTMKKRMFSSAAAFAQTLERHRVSLRGAGAGTTADLPDWMDGIDWDDDLIDDMSGSDAEGELLNRVASGEPGNSAAGQRLLDDLVVWCDRHAEPSDSKVRCLVDYLRRTCQVDGTWNDERVIVFTEYRDTQVWLAGQLEAAGLGGDHLGLLYGGMDVVARERLKNEFQAPPDRAPVRILLATDTASEGIDLQRHCHRLVHYDIPFNPNRLEQRIGRVDRHGQHTRVEVLHFVGAGWQQAAAGSFENDLEYLTRVATKVATEREDLGSVNPVLAAAVEARMLGRPTLVDPMAVTTPKSTTMVRAERELREEVSRLREQLQESESRLHVGPANVRRVVDVALDLASQPALKDDSTHPGRVHPPELRHGWERTLMGLADPLTGDHRQFTFDPRLAATDPDLVLAHLEHPLVAQGVRLLRSAVWGGRTQLHRVAAVRADLPAETDVDAPMVAVFSRLVIVGGDGVRLHEEVMLTGRILAATEGGRSKRLELDKPKNAPVRVAVEHALDPGQCTPAEAAVRARVAREWPTLLSSLHTDVELRRDERIRRLSADLRQRETEAVARVNGVFDQLRQTLQGALQDGTGVIQLSFDDLLDEERHQVERDRAAWLARLDGLDDERQVELETITSRYASLRTLVFPFAVAVVQP